MSSSAKIAGGDIQLSVDRAGATAELEQLRSTVRSAFAGMSDDALKFASAQDRLDRALRSSNGKITASVRSAELNLRRVQSEASKSNVSVARSANASSSALRREEQAVNRLGRGFLSGSGLASHFGRSIAFASSTFLGGAGLIFAIRSATDAAVGQQAAEGQLETALKNRGQVVEQLRGNVSALVAANAQLGFGEGDVTKALTIGVTTTGSLAGATRLLAVAQNVARAKGTDLYSATQLVIKGFLGQSRGIKSLGVDLATGVKGWAALDAVQGKYAGRAVAYANSEAGARAKANAQLERTKITIGNDLLPVENKLASAVADYLGKASTQQKIQDDVNAAMKTGANVVHGVESAYHDLAPVLRTIVTLLGGAKKATEALLAVYAGAKISHAITELGLLKVATAEVGTTAAVSEAEAATSVAAVGTSATVAKTKVGGLRTSLAGLGALQLAPIVIPIAIHVEKVEEAKVKSALGGVAGDVFSAVESVATGGVAGRGIVKQIGDAIFGGGKSSAPDHSDHRLRRGNIAGNPPITAGSSSAAAPARRPLDRLTKINLAVSAAQLAVARGDKGSQTQLVAALKDQIDYDRDYEKKQEDLIRRGVGDSKQHATTLASLRSDEQGALDQITSIESAAAAKRKAAHDKAAAAAEKAAKEEKAAAEKRARLAAKQLHDRLAVRALRLTNAVAAAKLTDGTLADDRKAYAALIAFDKLESTNQQLTLKERQTYVAKELAAKKQLADLDKKKTTSGGAAADQAQLLADLHNFTTAFAPNALPDPHTGKIATHGYNTVHELRQINGQLAKIGRTDAFPASRFGRDSAISVAG
jgi:hypothetical protein